MRESGIKCSVIMEGSTIKSRIKNLLRSPSMKLRKNRRGMKENQSSKVTLERVLGITTAGTSGLTCDPNSGTVAYPAGCVVVLLNPAKNSQQHLINSSRKTISALSFSSDGKYLVTGECGHLPAVRVWDVCEGMQVAELQQHKYGVSCVAFSPNSKYIVSVGSQHDMSVNVWAWKKRTLVAANKVSCKVTAVSFSEDSSHFVTAGNRHVRFWYLEPSLSKKLSTPVPLMGHSGLLGKLQNNFFCDVACGRGQKSNSTFCITSSGLLCEFNHRRILEKWVDLQTISARSLSVTDDLIFCGCANGTVRVFSAPDLRFICTLPRPHHLGIDVAAVTQASHLFFRKPDAHYPDSVALTFDPVNRWLSCVYNDHSIYVWSTRDLRRVDKVHSALYHSAAVWDLQMYSKDSGVCKSGPGSSEMFFSCSTDNTVRMWSADGVPDSTSGNVLSDDLHKVMYMDDNSASLRDIEGTAIVSDKPEGCMSDCRSGIRSICVSPDGRQLASGDRSGTLRVHDLTCMKEILRSEVHESEILSLQYSKPHTDMNLLATASRDRLIHVLDVDEDYSLLQTLDEHSSYITAVHFTASEGRVRLISCGADKSVYIRTAHRTVRGTEFKRTHHVVRKTSLNDMDIDPTCKYAAVGCQDRSIRVLNVSSGKIKRSYKGSQTDDGSLLKVQIDPSGLFVASSCSDKNISLFDFHTGECLAAVFGHSEIITGLKFTSDCRRLISASGDSCIFIWRLAPELTINMSERLSRLKQRHTVKNTPFRCSSASDFTLNGSSFMSCSSESDREVDESLGRSEGNEGHQDGCHRLSVSETSIEEEPGASDEGNDCKPVQGSSVDSSPCGVASRPRRRWSSRIGSLELMVKSMMELRQLDSLSEEAGRNRSFTEPIRTEGRGSTVSLQECSKKRRARPHSAWLTPASKPEPDGVVLYPEHCTSRTSLPGPTDQVQSPAEGGQEREDTPSPVSGFSMGYCSGASSPDQQLGDSDDPQPLSSDDELCERVEVLDSERKQISNSESFRHEDFLEALSDGTGAGTRLRPDGIVSAHFLGQKSTSRTGTLFKASNCSTSVKVMPTVKSLIEEKHREDDRQTIAPERETVLWSSTQRSHPYLTRVSSPISKPSAGLQKSASGQCLPTDTCKSLTSSRLRREARPILPKLIMEKNECRSQRPSPSAPSSPQSWESPKSSRPLRARSYMSPTTSSRAKITRSVSIGEDLHLVTGSGEILPSTSPSSPSRMNSPFPSYPSSTTPAEPKHTGPKALPSKAVKPRLCQRMSSPFSEWSSRSTTRTFHEDSSVEFQALHVEANIDSGPTESVITPRPEDQQPHELFCHALQRERPQVAVKAFSVTCDMTADQECAVSVEVCRRAAADLFSSVQRTTQLYRTLVSCAGAVEQQQMLADVLLQVRSELDSVTPAPVMKTMMMMEEEKNTLSLLEQYSQLLLQSVEKRLQQHI
ncbi:mitogen-activated protein kinase-binding protein 1-like [Xyrauchen texanus]|uniref:mitogen-activated protein kinase-binding protein 1-like n=1 Tax=Xyrauchen texanus TaxID=154827 RepID=UPI0022429ABE|nr:mitogen-activated protein kinase-binding protein 1-like [Xyrauchen texanus]